MKHEGLGEAVLHNIMILLDKTSHIEKRIGLINDLRCNMNKSDMLMILAWTEGKREWKAVYETINNEMYKVYGVTFEQWKGGQLHGIHEEDS